MKPAPFAFLAANSRGEALQALASASDAKFIAGGQSLVPMMALRLVQPELLVDLNSIDDLSFVDDHDGAVTLGAMTRTRQVERSPVVAARQPLIVEALSHVGHVQIRNRGTVGGSLAHADPAAELPVTMVALEASLLAESLDATRNIPAREFFVSYFTTCLADDELLTEIRVPAQPARTGSAFIEVSRRRGDFALVAAAVTVTLVEDGACDHVRVALGGVSDRPVDVSSRCGALIGARVTEDTARRTSAEACAELEPTSDIHASAHYRRRVAAVLVRRALVRAAGRADTPKPPDDRKEIA